MLRTINILLVILMLAGAGIVYDLKYEAERATAKVARIDRKIGAERDAIATLKAEWSLLNQPRRLQDLTERYHSYLELDPLDPTQIGTLDDIPFKAATAGDAPAPMTPPPKGSVKLAQPDKGGERSAGIGKLLDRLPGGRGDGPVTTGSVPKSKTAPASAGPMVLVPKIVVPKPAGSPAKANR
jgi:hypothetical protein